MLLTNWVLFNTKSLSAFIYIDLQQKNGESNNIKYLLYNTEM